VASTAGDPAINGDRPGLGFDDVIKSVATRAIEMNGPVFGHDIAPQLIGRKSLIADCAAFVASVASPKASATSDFRR
jgi:hypothetical protein